MGGEEKVEAELDERIADDDFATPFSKRVPLPCAQHSVPDSWSHVVVSSPQQ